jgi:hypothetical protein
MWRSFFLAVGISLGILGGECLVFEKATLKGKEEAPVASYLGGIPYLNSSPAPSSTGEIRFPDWAPYALLTAGAVIICYSATVAKA